MLHGDNRAPVNALQKVNQETVGAWGAFPTRINDLPGVTMSLAAAWICVSSCLHCARIVLSSTGRISEENSRNRLSSIGWIEEAKMCASVDLVNTYMGLPSEVACADTYTTEFLPKIEMP